MKLFALFILSIFMSLTSFLGTARSQAKTEEKIVYQVEQELQRRFDLSFDAKVVEFNGSDKYIYQDPYGTLSDSYLVMAKGLTESYDNKNVIGIFKNGQLEWTTRPILAGATFTDFLGSRELNKDNKVELIFGWKLGMNPKGSHLWIITWDGNNGEIINEFDSEGKPEIYANGDVIFYPDYEGDGVYELMTFYFYDEDENEDNDILLKIKWDGISYKVVEKVKAQELSISNYRRNNFKANINTWIESVKDNLIRFNFRLNNAKNSVQGINELYLLNSHSKIMSPTLPSKFRFLSSRYGFLWLSISAENELKYTVKAGEEINFSFEVNALPRINSYFIQGFNDYYVQASLNATDKEIIYDIKNNSVTGKTLGPWVPDPNLSPVAFTDSLRSFSAQACELEWITNKGICKSLGVKLDNVTRQLQRGNTKTAANNVQAFLNEVEAVRRNHLTSEGYGLLHFNASYLLKQLREED